jgi:hypothetical protein
VGEKPLLFLFEENKKRNEPNAVAEVKEDGFYLKGKKIPPSRGSVIQPAMQMIQEELKHRNKDGQLVSRSAWRQWYVVRDGKLVSLFELKDPAKAKKRGRVVESTTKSLEELDL